MANFSGPATPVSPASLTPMGYQQIAGLSAATPLTVPNGATLALIQVSGAAVRYRDDGTAPTASLGMPIAIGTTLTYANALSAIQFIQETSAATLDILYYK